MTKKVLKILIPGLLLSLITTPLCLCAKNRDLNRARADGTNITPSYLGTFYTYDRVSENTKVVIPSSSISFIEATGREVFSEWVDSGGLDPIPFDPPIPMGGNLNNPDSFHHPVLQYYYIATPYDGIVHNQYSLYNTYSSLKIVLEQLKKDVEFAVTNEGFTINNSSPTRTKNNFFMYYLRSQRTSYTSEAWEYVAGENHTYFSLFIDCLRSGSGALKISEYLHYVSLSNEVKFIDPLDPTSYVDIVHMFASLDGTVYATDRNGWLDFLNLDKFVRHGSSWGGDLQTACDLLRSSYNTNLTMQDIFGTPAYGFDWEDLRADQDAIVIGANFNAETGDIYDAITTYYENTFASNRISSMVYGMADISSINYNNLSNLRSTIYDMVALTSSGNDNWSVFLDWSQKYNRLIEHGGEPPSVACRKGVADLFYDYIMGGM